MTPRSFARVALASALLVAAACAKTPPPDPRYRPVESVLEVIAVLRLHVDDDTYRFPPATDFTGRNVYRSSLLRLENLERTQADALRAGHMDEVIAFSKARALERLRAFQLAAATYRSVAERNGELAQEARRSAAVCDALDEAARSGFDPDRPPGETPVGPEPRDGESVVAAAERRVALLQALRPDVVGTHYEHVVDEEIERADVGRASWFVAARRLTPDGDVRALSELQRVAMTHKDSKLASRHLLSLADLFASLAEEYVEMHPPEGMLFDPATFQELVDSTSRLYDAVGRQDGTPEKLEASQRLEAFLAFTLRVDRDRFTP